VQNAHTREVWQCYNRLLLDADPQAHGIVDLVLVVEVDGTVSQVRLLKDSKLKVQASIQGDAVRVSGAKKDLLQEAIALVKKSVTDIPLQYQNFRD